MLREFNNLESLNKQHGSVLTVSLFILLVITIVGATAINDTVMEEKMSSNFQTGHAAFQATESSVNRTVLEIAQHRDLVLDAMDAHDIAERNNNDPVWPTTPEHVITSTASSSGNTVKNQSALNSTVQYVGKNQMPAAGCTIVIGRPTSCMAVVVDVVASGTVNNNIRHTHRQGTQKLMPTGG